MSHRPRVLRVPRIVRRFLSIGRCRTKRKIKNTTSLIRSAACTSPRSKRMDVVRWKGGGAPTRFMDFTRPPPSPVVRGVGLRGLSGSSPRRFDGTYIYMYCQKNLRCGLYRTNDYVSLLYNIHCSKSSPICVLQCTRVSTYIHIIHILYIGQTAATSLACLCRNYNM